MINRIRIILIIIILLLSIISNHQCYSQLSKFRDVTPSGIKYRAYINGGSCAVGKSGRFYVLCQSNPCSYSTIEPSMVTVADTKTNSTSTLYTLEVFNFNIIGLYDVKIDNNLLFQIECLRLDIDTVELQKVTDYFQNPEIIYSSIFYGIVYKAIGPNIDYSILDTYNWADWSCSRCSQILCSVNYGSNGYITFRFQLSIGFKDDVGLPLVFSFGGKQFSIEPIIKSNYINITNIKTYPSSLIDYQMQGNGEGGAVELTTNTLVYDSPTFLLDFDTFPSISFQYYPIKGDSQSTTYLISIINTLATSYNILSQNGTAYLYVKPIPCSIKSYFIGQVGSTFQITEYKDLVKPMVSLDFTYDYSYNFTTINSKFEIGSNAFNQKLKFPFGFVSNSASGFTYRSTLLTKLTSYGTIKYSLQFPDEILFSRSIITQDYNTSKLPILYRNELVHLFDDVYLMKLYPKFGYDFGYIKVNQDIKGIETKVNDNITQVYEVLIQSSFYSPIELFDSYNGNSVFHSDTLLSNDNNIAEFFKFPSNSYQFDQYSIQNVSYLYNNLNITNHRQYNVMYFNYTDDVPRDITIVLVSADISYSSNLLKAERDKYNEFIFYGSYNYELGLFQVEFFIDANIAIGEYQMILIIGGNSLHSKYFNEKLIIKSSSMDLQGPLITKVKRSEQLNISDYILSSSGDIYWDMTIEDTINGFDYGYIVIRGSLDQSIYNFTITPSNAISGDIFIGQYQFKFQVNYPCVSQNYVISEVVLYDRLKRMSIYATNIDSQFAGVMNPFLNLLNDPTIYSIPLTCQQSNPVAAQDTTPPVLISFSSSVGIVDIFTLPNITFNFAASDLESGIKKDQYPIVYLSTSSNKILECKSNITSITKNITTVYGNTITYSCTIQIPLGFGYLDGISLSVYGFINNNGYYSGYSTTDLNDNGKDCYIATQYNESSNPVFTSYYRISERGGDLWLTGRGFTDSITLVTVEYEDGTKQYISVDNVHFTVLRVPGIRPTTRPFKVSSPTTNTITVIPIIYNSYLNNSTDSSSSSDTPLPTNSPQSCPGNPICGGPSNGKCIENQGCVCYSPWIGLDCLSQIIIIDQPTTNDTSPSTNITLPVNNNNSSTTVTYKSLITLVSIRELNILGSVVYNKSFDKWQVRKLDSTTFIYNTTLSINKNNQISTTEFTVTLKWFTNETAINFANEQLLMNPSTMKYTIEINNYPFDNNLNQLQLIMSASLQSNSSDNICSLREYGETTSGDNSNYLKIQVDNHSLFGRFIRRGIIDSTITTITNVLLDKDMNSITTTKELQSYIAIQIPNYKISVTVDPDFSIIIDSHSASSKSNSICSDKSKLTNGKIAGIVIGCAAFLAVIIIAVSYHIIKKNKDAKFVQNVNQKMKNMNNDKL